MKVYLFACVHNAGRSQMAAALFNHFVREDAACAISAGTKPADTIHAEVSSAMVDVGIDLSPSVPQQLTPELAETCSTVITMGCRERCPSVPGVPVEDWPVEDPKGKTRSEVAGIRDQIKEMVHELLRRDGLC